MTANTNQFRTAKLIHGIMMAVAVLYIFLPIKLAVTPSVLPASFVEGISVGCGVVLIVAYGFRAKMLDPAVKSLRRDPLDPRALIQWRKASIVVAVLLLSAAQFGLVLRLLGGSLWTALPFYAASLVLFVVWAPREVTNRAS